MADSIDFNDGNDMSAHGLKVISPGMNLLRQLVGRVQLQDKGYAFKPMREPRHITVECVVTGTSLDNLDANLDAIKRILTHTVPKELIFDSLPLRYYNAILESFEGEYSSATLFRGTLVFICPDPLGYSKTLDDSPHDIGVGASVTVNEPVGGTGYVAPVYTLTAKNKLTGALIKLENTTTEEELQWTGSLEINDTLVINVAKWLVSKGVTADMASVTGRFPRLRPNTTNQIKVTGLAPVTQGKLNIKYRDTYL